MTTIFVQGVPGLEPALADELAELGLRGRIEVGGVELPADARAMWAVHLHSRLAGRVWVRVARFGATQLEQLAAGVRRAPWSRWAHPRQPVEVRVASSGSRLRHREAIEKKVAHAIADALRGPRLPTGRPPREPVGVLVRIVDDRVEVSVDASGDLLHRRGWRQATAKAPLRENLAAAVLRLVGWAPGEALVDPMCGSGTFPIEAATIAMGLPPGGARGFAFERWPSHDAAAWAAFQRRRPAVLDTSAPIVGTDRDPGAVEAARGNARRARVADRVVLRAVDFRDLEPPAPTGLLVANPPYGERVSGAAPVFAELGRTLRARWAGWRFALLVPDRGLLGRLRLPTRELARFRNGGIPVALVAGEVEGAPRPT